MNIISWIPPAQDWFSKSFPNIDIRWINLIFILIFIAVMYWILHELYTHLEESENKKPLISVVPKQILDLWCLEVTNSGAKAIFSAVVIIVPKQTNIIGERYDALWAKTMTDKTELMNGQNDVIKIASIKFTDSIQYFEMKAYDTIKKAPGLVRHIEYMQFVNKVHMNIQVIISSSPVLKDSKTFIRTYNIGSHYIMESKHQLKRLDSIPYKLLLGDDDIDTSN